MRKPGKTAVFEAVRAGDLKKLKRLHSEGADFKARDRYGYTPLHRAAKHGYHDVCQFLIDCCVDVFALTNSGRKAVDLAERGRFPTLARMLDRAGDRQRDAEIKAVNQWRRNSFGLQCFEKRRPQ